MLSTGMTWTTKQDLVEIEATIRLTSTPALEPYADILLRNADEGEGEYDYFLWLCDASNAELIANALDMRADEVQDELIEQAEFEAFERSCDVYAQNDTEAWIEDMDYTNSGYEDDYDNSDDDHYGEDNYGFDYDCEQECYD